jgi:hypothetical protein
LKSTTGVESSTVEVVVAAGETRKLKLELYTPGDGVESSTLRLSLATRKLKLELYTPVDDVQSSTLRLSLAKHAS